MVISLCFDVFDVMFVTCLLFGDRPGTSHPRGPLAPRQKGGRRPQASGDEPQGQGLEIPSYSNRVTHPPSRSLLQEQAADPTDVQVRLCDGLDAYCVIFAPYGSHVWLCGSFMHACMYDVRLIC